MVHFLSSIEIEFIQIECLSICIVQLIMFFFFNLKRYVEYFKIKVNHFLQQSLHILTLEQLYYTILINLYLITDLQKHNFLSPFETWKLQFILSLKQILQVNVCIVWCNFHSCGVVRYHTNLTVNLCLHHMRI